MEKIMIKKIFIVLLITFGDLHSWEWSDTYEEMMEEEEREKYDNDCPFNVKLLDCYMTDLTHKYGTPSRTTTYDFRLDRDKEEGSYIYRGRDQRLDLIVRLEFADKDSLRPLRCFVENNFRRPFFASDIAIFQINGKRVVYLVSFYESDATLIVTRGKDTPVTAQWAILKREFIPR